MRSGGGWERRFGTRCGLRREGKRERGAKAARYLAVVVTVVRFAVARSRLTKVTSADSSAGNAMDGSLSWPPMKEAPPVLMLKDAAGVMYESLLSEAEAGICG
jgi:hypothetical protein